MQLVTWGGLSRHGVMATARQIRRAPRPSRAVRFAWVVPSTVLIGFGVGLLLAADLGVPPYDVLLSAIAGASPLSHGQAGWAMSGALMLVAVGLGVRPKMVGLAYVFFAGVAVDAARQVIVTPDGIGLRIAMAASGVVLLTAGVAVIVHTSATGGAFELIIEAAGRRGMNPVKARSALELSVLAVGVIGGGSFGVMTVIVAFTVGPMIAITLQAFADHQAGRHARIAPDRDRVLVG
jgi:uncharacterized membrane protein YczE